MTTVRRSSTPMFDDIEDAYRTFLTKTWIAVPALVAFVSGIIAETSVILNPDGTPKRSDLYDDLGVLALVFLPLAFCVLAITRGRLQLRTIAFGRLNSWQIVLLGVVLATIAQLPGRVIFPLFGGSVVSANDDPSVMGTIIYFLSFVVLTAINEEVMFRTVMQTYLQRYGTATAIVGTAAIFTLFHLPHFDRMPTHDEVITTIVFIPIPALILSVARRYSGSLLFTLVIHMADNSFGIIGHRDVPLPGCC